MRDVAATPSRGYLAIADLSGYTAYLSRGEIEHAPTIAGDLLETVVGRLEPPFRLAKLEGDAVFVYAEEGRAEPSLLLDAVEAAYFAFRRRLRSIDAATACDCNACRLAPQLDLKLFVHHGWWIAGSIAGRDELAGPDVILVHRLLKGAAAAERTRHGFAVFTRSALEALGIEPVRLDLTRNRESIEHIGEVETFVLDLEARWQQEDARRLLADGDGLTIHELDTTLPVDRSVAWSYLTSPALRSEWEGAITIQDETAGGRVGPGTTTRCVTGRLASLEEVVDWQPHEHIGWRVAVRGIGPVAATADLESTDDGTQVRLRWSIAPEATPSRSAVQRLRREKTEAIGRLATRLRSTGRELPVVQEVQG